MRIGKVDGARVPRLGVPVFIEDARIAVVEALILREDQQSLRHELFLEGPSSFVPDARLLRAHKPRPSCNKIHAFDVDAPLRRAWSAGTNSYQAGVGVGSTGSLAQYPISTKRTSINR